MPVNIELEALPSAEEVDNILKDLTRVFVIEWRHQVTHTSGTANTEILRETVQWSLPKGVMVKVMKIAVMRGHDAIADVAYIIHSEVYLDDEDMTTDAGADGVLDSINNLFMHSERAPTTTAAELYPIERNWEPGKVLPKNECKIYSDIDAPGTEAKTCVLTMIIHIHYQLFRYEEVDSDNLMWEKATIT